MLLLLLSLFSASAQAMPCDISAIRVSCMSASGKYSFETITCGYDQSLDNANLTVKGEPKLEAKTTSQWFGRAFYAVEFDASPANSDAQRLISFEWSAATGRGTVTDKSRDSDPAPWKSKTEAATCKVVDVTDQG